MNDYEDGDDPREHLLVLKPASEGFDRSKYSTPQQTTTRDECAMSKSILITGGAGFIASHVVRCFALKYPKYKVRAKCRLLTSSSVLKRVVRSSSWTSSITALA